MALYCQRCCSQSPSFFLKICLPKCCCCSSIGGCDGGCALGVRCVHLGSALLAPVPLAHSHPSSCWRSFSDYQIDRDDHDECDDCVCPEHCERMSLSSVHGNVADDQAHPKTAHGDANWFSTNTKFHVFVMMGEWRAPIIPIIC